MIDLNFDDKVMNKYICIVIIFSVFIYVKIFSENKDMNLFSKILFSLLSGICVAIAFYAVFKLGFKMNF